MKGNTDAEKQVRFIKDLVTMLASELAALEQRYVAKASEEVSKQQEIDQLEQELCKYVTGLVN